MSHPFLYWLQVYIATTETWLVSLLHYLQLRSVVLQLGFQKKKSFYPSALQLQAWNMNPSKTPFPPTLLFVTQICFTTECGRSASALPVHLNAPPVVVSAAYKTNASSTKGNTGTHEVHTYSDIQTPSRLPHGDMIIQKFFLILFMTWMVIQKKKKHPVHNNHLSSTAHHQ